MSTSAEQTHIAGSLLSRAHSPNTAGTIFKERVKQRPLLLRPSSPDPDTNARQKRRKARQARETARQRKSRKPKPLSAKQKRTLCIYDIPKEQQKYDIYVPLHDLWCNYMREILGVDAATNAGRQYHVTPATAGPMLTSADYHGALIEVVRSGCVSRVGLQGIVLKDTKFTFEIITSENALKTIPKEHSQFRFMIPLGETASIDARPLIFEIHGSQFENRPPDRANKKFKQHIDPEL